MRATMVIICVLVMVFISVPCFAEPLVIGGPNPSMYGIHVYDGDDNYMGLLLSKNSYASPDICIYNPQLDKLMFPELYDGRLSVATVYYESTNCSGPPLIASKYMYQINRVHLPPNCEMTFFTGDTTEAPVPTQTRSHTRIEISFDYIVCPCVQNYEINEYVVPAIEISPESLPFTGDHPKLPLRFKTGIK